AQPARFWPPQTSVGTQAIDEIGHAPAGGSDIFRQPKRRPIENGIANGALCYKMRGGPKKRENERVADDPRDDTSRFRTRAHDLARQVVVFDQVVVGHGDPRRRNWTPGTYRAQIENGVGGAPRWGPGRGGLHGLH